MYNIFFLNQWFCSNFQISLRRKAIPKNTQISKYFSLVINFSFKNLQQTELYTDLNIIRVENTPH